MKPWAPAESLAGSLKGRNPGGKGVFQSSFTPLTTNRAHGCTSLQMALLLSRTPFLVMGDGNSCFHHCHKALAESNLERKWLIWLTHPRSQSMMEPRAGTEAETMQESCLLACFLSLPQPEFLLNSGSLCLGVAPPPGELCLPTSIMNLENALHACL